MAVTEPFCRFETADGADVVALLPGLNDAPWGEIENVGNGLLERVRGSTARVVIVDLTALNYMGSALVAMLVRVWKVVKERGGRLVVINRDPMVAEVLKIAGLDSLWPIVETREEAIATAAAPPEAVRRRETRLLTFVGPLAVVAAGAGLALLILKAEFLPPVVAVGLALGWSLLGILAGAVTFVRSIGGVRALGGLVVAACLGIGVATAFFWPDDLLASGDDEQPAAAPAVPPPVSPGQDAPP